MLDEAEESVCAAEGQRESKIRLASWRALLILGILEVLDSWEPVETVVAEEHVVSSEETVCAEEHVVESEESVCAEEHVDVEAVAERVAALADWTVLVECLGATNDGSRGDGRVDEVKTVDAGDPWPVKRVVTWTSENLATGIKECVFLAKDDVLGGGPATVLCGGGGMNDIWLPCVEVWLVVAAVDEAWLREVPCEDWAHGRGLSRRARDLSMRAEE